MKATENKIHLTISENYVSGWAFWEAIREVLQNAIDSNKMQVIKKEIEGTVSIKNEGSICLSSLMLGETSKSDDSSSIGKYGEGYKLALLVLRRAGYDVRIKTGFETWYPSIEKHPQLGVNSLCINIEQNQIESKNVEFLISGLDSEDFDLLDEKFICNQSCDVISSAGGSYCFDDYEYDNKRLFVGGLFVCDLDGEYKYSWNFAPNVLDLDRDRNSANGFHVDLEATRMLSSAGDYGLIAELAKDGFKDVSSHFQSCGGYIETQGKDNKSIRDLATDNFINQYGNNAYPINGSESPIKNQIITKKCLSLGLEPVVIPSQFYVLLSKELTKELTHNGKRINKASEALTSFLKENKKHIRSKAKKDLVNLIDDLILQGN